MYTESEIILPRPLRENSRVAILAPASAVKREYVEGAAGFLRSNGFEPCVMPSASGSPSGSYAAPYDVRRSDMLRAIEDPGIDAILCARGGYGAVHLLPDLAPELLRGNPKWLIGFSDITALHAAWLRAGVVSLHAPMAKHLCEEGIGNGSTRSLLSILRGESPICYRTVSGAGSRSGVAEGMIVGGNLAVMSGLAATPFDIPAMALSRPVILFIEDIAEAIYSVERMLYRLHLAGVLKAVKGIIVGQFTEYRSDRNFNTVEEMISALFRQLGVDSIPVAFGFPVGHTPDNLPIAQGMQARLTVTESTTTLVISVGGQ